MLAHILGRDGRADGPVRRASPAAAREHHGFRRVARAGRPRREQREPRTGSWGCGG